MDQASHHYMLFTIKAVLSLLLPSVVAGYALMKWHPLFCLTTIKRISNFWNGYTVKIVTFPDGFTFEYMERGEKTKCKHSLMMVHGFSGTKSDFNTITKYFPKRDFHLLAIDLPGHGGTTRDVKIGYKLQEILKRIKQFVDAVELNESKFHIVGHSFGGLLAGMYAHAHPDDLLSLTLMSCGGFKIQPKFIDAHLKVAQGIETLFNESLTVADIKKVFGVEEKQPPDFIFAAIVQVYREGRDFFKPLFAEMTIPENMVALDRCRHAIKVPTLIIWGLDDKVAHFPDDKDIASGMPALKKFVAFEKCGHMITMDQPERCAAEIQDHIKTCNN